MKKGKFVLLSSNSVKEAMDNLPAGMCFFSKRGTLILCNRLMYEVILKITGQDLQCLSDIRNIMDSAWKRDKVKKEGTTFILPDHSAWHFYLYTVADENQNIYIQCMAAEITDLYRSVKVIEQKNSELREIANNIERINRNIEAIAREEEILTMKMKIHNELGSTLLSTRRYVENGLREEQKKDLLLRWKQTVSSLQGEIGKSDETDAFEELCNVAIAVGAEIKIEGEMPEDAESSYLLVCAMRACLMNTISHTQGTILLVNIRTGNERITAEITNNGENPNCEIVEGGGLSSLRQKIEKAGGSMTLQSLPRVLLTVDIPKRGKGYL